MKVWNIIKYVLYVALSALCLILTEEIVENVRYLIGGLMILYSSEPIVRKLLKHDVDHHLGTFVNDCIEFCFGLILIFFIKDFTTILVIWASWAIIRESQEITEIVEWFKEGAIIIPVLSIIESAIAIYLSVGLLLEPGHHHATLHVYLLSIELITRCVFPLVAELEIKHHEKKLETK